MLFFVALSYWKKMYLMCSVCILFAKKKMLGGTCNKNLLNYDLDSYSYVERFTF